MQQKELLQGKIVTNGFALTLPLLQRVRKIAREERRSASSIIRLALAAYLEEYYSESEDDEKE